MLSDLRVVLSGTFSGIYTEADRKDVTVDFISIGHATMLLRNNHFRCIFCGRSYARRYVWEKPVCLFIDCKCFIWLDAKAQVESNYTEIIFIPEVINTKCAANSM